MTDRDNVLQRIARADDDRLADHWSGSHAEQTMFEEIRLMAINTQPRSAHHGSDERVTTPRWRRPALGMVTALAAVAALTVVVATVTGPPVEAQAAEALREVSGTAAQRYSEPLPDGMYQYTKHEGLALFDTDGGMAQDEYVSEYWSANDGSGRVIWRSSTDPEDNYDDTYSLADTTGDSSEVGSVFPLMPGLETHADLERAATDPDALHRRIETTLQERYEGEGGASDAAMFEEVTGMLGFNPAFDAALFQVLAKIPSVQLVDAATDSQGRDGRAVSIEHDDVRIELLFDPGTGDILEEREILLERVDWIDGRPGDVVSRHTLIERAVVDSTDTRP